ncbi:DUF5347 family protein [Xenorhabdus sp. SF857]|uniref:DUF5347 family protein n=1 Tax=Xenorhabdus bakwenae TaxID=3026967 RepID=UPI00255810C2|nr:DUF5347 family protein [Xenorhabdus sp. SF857]WFQ80024.1 DUF5347 family protein [Xenorhabdus sp. SF857]
MANTESHRAISLTLDEKIRGMNKTAEFLSGHFDNDGLRTDKQLADFLDYMRDRTNNRVWNNERFLHMMFHMAGFDKSRYHIGINEFTPEEKKSFIFILHQCQAICSVLPNKLVIPKLTPH